MARLDRYDEHGQDTWTSPDEELFAAEMGQPSTEPPPHHRVCPKCEGAQAEPGDVAINFGIGSVGRPEIGPCPHSFHGVPFEPAKPPAVLAQTPVTCAKCGRHAVPFEDVIVLVDGLWLHDECHENT